jgi:glutaminase
MLECPLFAGVDAGDRAAIRALLHRRSFRAGEVLVDIGAPAGEVFFIARGTVSVFVPVAGGGRRRLGAFSAGMAFGEMAMLDRAPRSAQVIADTDVDCDLLRIEDFERLGSTHPQAKITLLHNLALSLSARLRKANREIRALDC